MPKRRQRMTRSSTAPRSLAMIASAVGVPVFFGHRLPVHATCGRSLSPAEGTAGLLAAKGISVIEADSTLEFPTPATLATAPDKVYVGRLRADPTRDKAL